MHTWRNNQFQPNQFSRANVVKTFAIDRIVIQASASITCSKSFSGGKEHFNSGGEFFNTVVKVFSNAVLAFIGNHSVEVDAGQLFTTVIGAKHNKILPGLNCGSICIFYFRYPSSVGFFPTNSFVFGLVVTAMKGNNSIGQSAKLAELADQLVGQQDARSQYEVDSSLWITCSLIVNQCSFNKGFASTSGHYYPTDCCTVSFNDFTNYVVKRLLLMWAKLYHK